MPGGGGGQPQQRVRAELMHIRHDWAGKRADVPLANGSEI